MAINKKPARVRFAPSPTGFLHIGGARTALYDYLLARQTGGAFLLRIEDTDQKRYQHSAEEDFREALNWLGLEPDEGPDQGGPYAPYRQSLRKEIYQDHAKVLVKNGKAFYCFCPSERLNQVREDQIKRNETPHYDGTCRDLSLENTAQRKQEGESFVIRFKSPKTGKTVVKDLLRGEITVDNSTLDDMILIKSDGLALYHLAAIVDDYLMDITHVIRGSEWLPTFPIHSLIYRALGWQEPIWVHLSVFLKPDGKGKMSKRDTELAREQGLPIFIKDMDKFGYLPETVINWISLMGWSYDDKTEFFTLEDLIDKFSLEKLNPSPAAINFSKLDHFNGLHIRNLALEDFAARIKPWFEKAGYQTDKDKLLQIASAIQPRTKKLTEVVDMAGFFFEDEIELNLDRIISDKLSRSQAVEAARKITKLFQETLEINAETTEGPLRDIAAGLYLNAGQVFGLLRETSTGQAVSPPIFDVIAIIGKETVINRLESAVQKLEKLPK
jgi:glutamyl-tRNA synthetase